VHGHGATLRRALAELEVNEHDCVFSVGNLVGCGPDSLDALAWMTGSDLSTRFHAALRGAHEQMMLEALLEGAPEQHALRQLDIGEDPWNRWMANGGGWWVPNNRHHDAAAWIDALSNLPFCATIESRKTPRTPSPSATGYAVALAYNGAPRRQRDHRHSRRGREVAPAPCRRGDLGE